MLSESIMRPFGWVLGLFLGLSCSSGPPESSPFDAPPQNPWEVEQALQEVRSSLSHIGVQILAPTASLNDQFMDILKRGSPVLSAGIGRWKSFEGHTERAFLSPDHSSLSVLYSYEAHLSSEQLLAVHGEGALRFVLPEGSDAWELVDWALEWEKVDGAEKALFQESLENVVEPELLGVLRRSIHEEKVVDHLLGRNSRFDSHPIEYESFDRHPGLAIVDVDGNGWEDVYVVSRWGPNELLLNRNGRFTEAAALWGIDFDSHSTSAIFADLDNDGDPDLVLGRSLRPSLILENVGGRFEVRDVEGLPQLVSSIAVADVNSDGLLDVYWSTYAASMIERLRDLGGDVAGNSIRTLRGFMEVAEADLLADLIGADSFDFYLERPGPQNRLMINRGQWRFERSSEHENLGVYRNTYQASFSDIDLDGDPDLYLANDFSSNQLFENQEGQGFVDITEASGTSDFGFGMGVSWGDVDEDGLFDLYVSNMYSRAGRRMTRGVEGVDPRVEKAARGNSLFGNQNAVFERLSGLDEGWKVEEAGWAWGGQFLDINNNGLLDLYVPNGYYSAPKEAAIDRDT